MSIAQLLVLLVVAGICGSVAQGIVGYTHGGCLVSVALGLIGALVGTWLASAVGLPELLPLHLGGETFPILWSIIGAALFVAVLGFLRPRRTW